MRPAPSTSASRRAGGWVAPAAALLFAGCVLGDLLLVGARRAFGYAASDAYYYLDVAQHVVRDGRFAFDGEHATNGFHPLWQLALVPLAWLVDLAHGRPHHLLIAAVVLQALLLALALYLVGRCLRAHAPAALPLLPLTCVGGYGLAVFAVWCSRLPPGATPVTHLGRTDIVQGTLWSYVNGMESALVIALFALALVETLGARIFARTGSSVRFGLLLALLTLARLDHVFFALALAAAVALERPSRPRALAAAAAFALPLGIYLACNQLWFGSWMPISGALKSSFPHISTANLNRLRDCLLHYRKQDYYRLYRMLQIVLPAAVALVYGAVGLRRYRRAGRLERVLVALAPAVLVLALYDLLFVDLPMQGHWYFPVSTLWVTLVLFERLARAPRLQALAASRLATPTTWALLALIPVCFAIMQRRKTANAAYAGFYFDEAPRLVAAYAGHPPRILENDDGIVSFATGFRALSGMGLALDPEAAQAWKTGQIVPLAVARHHRHVTSRMYWSAYGLSRDSSSAAVARFLQSHLYVPHPEQFHYAVDYVDGDFVVLRVDPASEAPADEREP